MMGASISESSEIPKGKKLSEGPIFHVHPLFTGQVFIRRQALHFGDSRRPTETSTRTYRRTDRRGPKMAPGPYPDSQVILVHTDRHGARSPLPSGEVGAQRRVRGYGPPSEPHPLTRFACANRPLPVGER